MEIVFKNVSYKKIDNLNLKINNKITAMAGNLSNTIVSMLVGDVKYSGDILFDKEIANEKNKILRKISYVDNIFINMYNKDTIIEYMKYYIYNNGINLKNIEKKIVDSLRMVGLGNDYLDREINTLSTSELKLFNLSLALLNNPKVIILKDIYNDLDNNMINKLRRLFDRFNDKYNISIIILTNNTTHIYKYIDEVVIFKNNNVLRCGNSKKIFSDIEFLKNNRIDIPDIVLFTSKAREKGIKIDYHRDIRDLIKDIYKHV